jgi:mycothiol synthase
MAAEPSRNAALSVRPPAGDDLADVLALLQTAEIAVFGESDWTEQGLRDEWNDLDLARDAWLVSANGEPVGYGAFYDEHGGRFFADAYVHPKQRGRGVGSTLLELGERRARAPRAGRRRGGAARLQAAHLVGEPGAPELFAARGFAAARSFLRMVIDMEAPPPAPEWPAGIRAATFDLADARAFHAALEEAFADEWYHEPEPFDRFRERRLDRRGFDPSLCRVAWDGDEIAGLTLCDWKRNGDWGWVGALAVRRPWRRRGLGLALLREGFAEFHRRGEPRVALGVDTQNPTGAARLYERAGMRVLWQADVWEKPLAAEAE